MPMRRWRWKEEKLGLEKLKVKSYGDSCEGIFWSFD